MWPGDPLFEPERFGELSVSYVYNALSAGRKARRQELHEEELPVANLASLMANINRDAKKVKKPYGVIDFCFYASDDSANRPDDGPKNAYMALLDQKKLPRWALFVFADMKSGNAKAAPAPAAAVGEHVVLLAPQRRNGGLEGLLMATSEAYGQHVEVEMDGESFTVAVPDFEGHAVAREHVYVPLM